MIPVEVIVLWFVNSLSRFAQSFSTSVLWGNLKKEKKKVLAICPQVSNMEAKCFQL